MLFKSHVFSQASGSVAGLVYSHNQGGQYTRARTLPTNPQTAAQQAVRDAMSQLVVYWQETLSSPQREAWTMYAFNTPTLNRLGDLTKKTGQQMFLRSNIPRLQGGFAIVDDAPTTFDLGTFTPLTTIVPDESSNNISITFDDAANYANQNGAGLLIYQSRPMNPTRNFCKGPYQLLTTIVGNSLTPPTSPATPTALFPQAAGQRIFFRIRQTLADGRLSAIQNIDAFVAS